MIFENIIGNENNKELLKNIINKNNISHSYMFIGKESIGKMLFAKEFAKAILCLETEKPCNKCKSCIEYDSNNNPDISILEAEDNTIKISQIRELIKKVYEKPIVSSRKIYIINDSEKMTKDAQNSLLKTLEEPPEYITIILITSNENLFLPTIKSRCTKIYFSKLNNKQLNNILEEKYNYNNVSDSVLKVADGSVNKALNFQNKTINYENINKYFSNIENIKLIEFISCKEEIFVNKEDAREILEYINLILYDKIKTNIKYVNCMYILEKTKEKLNKNNNFDMTIDNFIITIWEEINGKYYRS